MENDEIVDALRTIKDMIESLSRGYPITIELLQDRIDAAEHQRLGERRAMTLSLKLVDERLRSADDEASR